MKNKSSRQFLAHFYQPTDRFYRRDLRPTRAYVQRHFSDAHTNTLSEQGTTGGKEKLYTIRESINEGITF